jgi:hypothetical protein
VDSEGSVARAFAVVGSYSKILVMLGTLYQVEFFPIGVRRSRADRFMHHIVAALFDVLRQLDIVACL